MFKKFRIRDYDFKLIFMVVALSIIGAYAIGSAQPSLQSKQFAGILGGILIMFAVSVFNYSFLLKFYWLMYALNIGLLLGVMLAGVEGGLGAQRWFQIGGLRFQPSETAKILLILFFAQFIMKYKEKLNKIWVVGICVVLILIPWIMIFKQPDLSTSVVVIVMFCVIMFAGGISYKYIFGVLIVAVPAFAMVIFLALKPDSDLLTEWQKNRIFSFINPQEYALEEAYQQLNSVMAIGSGKLDGKGYKNNEINSVKNGKFISEAQTDFIFAVIGEEFGFKGCVVVILLLAGISLECMSVARKAKDIAGRVIAAGFGGLVIFQGFFNIGVATFILPNTGLPLPFVSHGLTSLMSLYIGVGFVLSVKLQSPRRVKTQNIMSDWESI